MGREIRPRIGTMHWDNRVALDGYVRLARIGSEINERKKAKHDINAGIDPWIDDTYLALTLPAIV